MNNPTYQKRVQAIAKEISEKNNNKKWGPGLPDWNKSMESARIAVEHMAEAVAHALNELLPTAGPDYEDGDNKYVIQGYLSANGLIPDTDQEAVGHEQD